MNTVDFSNSIAVTRDIHWLGFHESDHGLHCNPYLLVDDQDVLLIDPGSVPDFSVVMRKVLDVVDLHAITYIVAQHQDPDVCGNIPVAEDVIENPGLMVVAQAETVRLIQHLGIKSKFLGVNRNHSLTLKSGRVIDFIATPYLHSPGAMITYDRKTKSLFTSDIFGSIDTKEWGLFAGSDQAIEAMRPWHQLYMPSSRILRPCIEMIEKMDVVRILPQHGSILEGEYISKAIAMLKELPCGVDL